MEVGSVIKCLTQRAFLVAAIRGALLLGVAAEAASADVNATYHFSLKKSVAPDVCNAYLEKLNSVDYDDDLEPPFCDRPESSTPKGFVALNRVPVSAEQQLHLFRDAWNLTHPYARLNAQRALEISTGVRNAEPVWTYSPPVDIENDGKPDKVLVWRGWGAQGGTGVCGLSYGGDGGLVWRSVQQGYILTPDGENIDTQRTSAVFGRNGSKDLYAGNGAGEALEFEPIGKSVSIFDFRGKVYFDAFFYGPSPYVDMASDLHIADRLGVFLHENGVTRQLCEFQMKDPELGLFESLKRKRKRHSQ